jgi:hypothetical protein
MKLGERKAQTQIGVRGTEEMKRTLSILGAVVLTLALAPAVIAATASEAPETTTIDDCVIKKAAVEFPHKTHADQIECATCHHTQEGLTADSTEEVPACGSCHNEPEAADTPICSQMSKSKNPFHISCVGCHKEKLAADEAFAGPTKCTECHPKAE